MYVHSFSYLLNKLELGGYTYLQLKNMITKYTLNKLRTAVLMQNTLSLGTVQGRDFSDTAYHSAYVSDVQILSAKSTLQQFIC